MSFMTSTQYTHAGSRPLVVTGVQTWSLPILPSLLSKHTFRQRHRSLRLPLSNRRFEHMASRRAFLGGAAGIGAATALAGLAGCAGLTSSTVQQDAQLIATGLSGILVDLQAVP